MSEPDSLWAQAFQRFSLPARLGKGLMASFHAELLDAPQANILFCRLPRHTIDSLSTMQMMVKQMTQLDGAGIAP